MASRQPGAKVRVGRPDKAVTGSLAECVEIRLGDYKSGYIQFVRRGTILEVLGGGIDAPVIQPAGKRGKAQATESEESANEEETPSALASVQHGQVRATQALLGPRAAVRFGAAVTTIVDGDREVSKGVTWEQAFKRAALDAGLWQEACAALARSQKRDLFVPVVRLTKQGVATLDATVMRGQVQFQDREGKLSEPIDGFSIRA